LAGSNVDIEFDSEAVLKFTETMSLGLAALKDRDMKFASMVSPIIFRDIIKHFEQEAGPTGRWVEWSKSYQNAIAKGWARKPGKILQDTGRMRNAFQISSFRRGANGYEWFNPAKTASGFPYAAAHDEGGPKLPQRQFMWLSSTALDQVMQITFAFLMGNK
jgi:phage gpG-like protein